jgi:hypothetical protein
VLRVAPGTEVIVTVQGAQPERRYLVRAGESDLTLLNVDDPAIPSAVRRLLLDIASTHAADLADAPNGHTFIEKSVRVGPDGVFVADRKVGDLAEIVRTIPRASVVEIRGPERTRGSKLGAVIGAAGGFFVGTVSALNLAVKQCGRSCDDERVLIALSLVGLPIGGGILGYKAFSHPTQDFIYSAP